MEHHNHSHRNHGESLGISIVLNVVITAAQAIGGVIAGSLSLITDALHNFSDVISLVVSYIAYRLSKREQTHRHTFGYKKAEVVAAFINASTLIVVAVFLVVEAIKRFNQPQEVESTLVVVLAAVGIIGNGVSVLLLRKGAKSNLNMRSAYLHMLSDMMTSVAVLVGGVFMMIYKVYWIDSLLAIVIATYLFYLSIKLLIESLRVLMLFAPTGIDIQEIGQRMCSFDIIKNVHHIHVWQMNDDEVYMEAHVDLKSDVRISEFESVLDQVEHMLREEFHIKHTIIQPEFNKPDDKGLVVQD